MLKLQKKVGDGEWGVRSIGGGGGGGGLGGCEPRIEVIVKMQKKNVRGPVGRGSRVDVNKELKLLSYCENAKKRKKMSGGLWSGSGGGSPVGGRVDVNKEFKLL